jgi:hypothetical protein
VGKLKGEFVWHSHPDTDDFSLVLKGRLTIQLHDGGVEHCPKADEETHVLLIEPKGTPNVGDSDAEAAPEIEI